MHKLYQLIALCKASISISINDHKDSYQSVKGYLSSSINISECNINPEVREEMIRRDTIVEITAYPDTPVGSYQVIHYDLESAVDEMLRIISAR